MGKTSDRNTASQPPEKRSLDWVTCPKHGMKYQLGSTCPKCDQERR